MGINPPFVQSSSKYRPEEVQREWRRDGRRRREEREMQESRTDETFRTVKTVFDGKVDGFIRQRGEFL